MKELIARLIEKYGTKLIGAWVTKAVTAASSMLVAHALMKPEAQGTWIATNADWITGLVLAGISAWLTSKRHAAQETKQVEALHTAPLGYKLVPDDASSVPTTNLRAGGVGAGNTDVRREP